MATPLICSANSLGHIDYGIPIVANKSTDYRTSTGISHQRVPEVPQDYDCRTKARIKKELLQKDVTLRDDVKSNYEIQHNNVKFKGNDPFQRFSRAEPSQNIDYVRNVQEKIFKNPPTWIAHNLSEMKDSYSLKYQESNESAVLPLQPNFLCDIKGLERDLQPAICPENAGFWKWLDTYLTTNRSTHIPFTVEQQNGIGRKDIITFYDATRVPPCKGFGPRNGPAVGPLLSVSKYPIYDKLVFKMPAYDRVVREPTKRVPNFGMQSEYRGRYTNQSFSHVQPYLFSNGEIFPDSLPDASPWQELASPGMYSTEYCHIGTGWPTQAIVDPGLPKEYLLHKPCFVKPEG